MKTIVLLILLGISVGCAMDTESPIKPLVHNSNKRPLLLEDKSIDLLPKPYSNCSIHINMLKEKAYKDGVEKGIKQGKKEVKLETALALLGMGANGDNIMQATGLTFKKLEKLKKKAVIEEHV